MISVKNKKAFTLIEIIIIVSIIGLLAAVMLALGSSSARDRAAINSYKTTMNSVQSAVELCGDIYRAQRSGVGPGSNICDATSGYSNVTFPKITEKCGDLVYDIGFVDGEPSNWVVSTGGGSTNGECRKCKIFCTSEGCNEFPGTNCNY